MEFRNRGRNIGVIHAMVEGPNSVLHKQGVGDGVGIFVLFFLSKSLS